MTDWKNLDIRDWKSWIQLVQNEQYDFQFNSIEGLNCWREGLLWWFFPNETQFGLGGKHFTSIGWSAGKFVCDTGEHFDQCRYKAK